MPNKKASKREDAAKKVIGAILKPTFIGLGGALDFTGKAINKGLSKVDAHAKNIRKEGKKKRDEKPSRLKLLRRGIIIKK